MSKSSPLSPARSAEKWMLAGITEQRAFVRSLRETKTRAISCGWYFMKARACLEADQSFTLFLSKFSKEVSERTVYYFMQFTDEVLKWAADEFPQFAQKPDKLLAAAHKMVLQSPKGLVALCRQLGEMRKFGEYDEVKYALKKRKGLDAQQIEFDFAAALTTIDLLAELDGQRVTFAIPEGKTEGDALAELEGKLRCALECVATRRAEVAALEAESLPAPDTKTLALPLPTVKQ